MFTSPALTIYLYNYIMLSYLYNDIYLNNSLYLHNELYKNVVPYRVKIIKKYKPGGSKFKKPLFKFSPYKSMNSVYRH